MSVPSPSHSRGAAASGPRLPWWALVLPALAFVALLMAAGPSGAHAAGGDALAHVVRGMQLALLG
ncbi:hypothetical protein AB0910_26980 [Streptomyces sp. NPDC047002]|uniref:hypothetical protein n=1 Tax=Streptomyces sp. NPDC047002 TaxID=3155475 RepID=UPI003457035F